MKTFLSAAIILLSCSIAWGEGTALGTYRRNPSPPSSGASQTLLWIADARKMDQFLAGVDLENIRYDTYPGEVLPDTRHAWRDYARQAMISATRGDDTAVNDRIGQMLKLAALYRQFGGLQNVVQGEEIRSLAAQTVQSLGYGGLIRSPYLESNATECIATIERQTGVENTEVRPICWHHLLQTARQSFARLSGQPLELAAEEGADRFHR